MEGHEPGAAAPQSLPELLSELTNRPVGDRRVDRLRAKCGRVCRAHDLVGSARSRSRRSAGCSPPRRAVGGTVLAGALAYRIFIWLLPLTLVVVLGLGLLAGSADRRGRDPRRRRADGIPREVGRRGGRGTRGWALVAGLVVGLVVLVYQSYALLRAVRAVTALAWRLPVRPPASPVRATLLFLAWMVAFTVTASSTALPRAGLAARRRRDARVVRRAPRALGRALVAAAAARGREHWRASARRVRRRNGADPHQPVQRARPLPVALAAGGDVRRARSGSRPPLQLLPRRARGRARRGPQRRAQRAAAANTLAR